MTLITIIANIIEVLRLKFIIDLIVDYQRLILFIVIIAIFFRKPITGFLKRNGITLGRIKDIVKRNRKTIIVVIVLFIICCCVLPRREGFRFQQPDLSLEISSKDCGWMCCASSYEKQPLLFQKAEGGCSKGDKMFYKILKPTEDGDELITSGMFNNYIVHSPGSYIEFNDGNLYKIISLNPKEKPENCRIVNLSETYDEADSNIPVQY